VGAIFDYSRTLFEKSHADGLQNVAGVTSQLGLLQPADRILADDERGTIVYRPAVFSGPESDALFERLLNGIPWSHDSVWMYDRPVGVPRLRMSYEDVSALPAPLQEVRERVEALEGAAFNRIGLNLYRDHNDSVAWHSDHEEMMVERPTVVLVSLGADRPMDIRERANHRKRWRMTLEAGSLLVMRGLAQRNYEHRIMKLPAPTQPRISVALRQYAPPGSPPQACAQCAGAKAKRR
jgi:alkylated DNA repair dioxygenase AlkB